LAKATGIKNYLKFSAKLEQDIAAFKPEQKQLWQSKAALYVDGLAAAELRRLVSLACRRKDGIFFTESSLAKKVLNALQPAYNPAAKIYDPACGAGNLLIAYMDYALENGSVNNISFYGTDIHQEFITAAELRLTLNGSIHDAATTHTFVTQSSLDDNAFYREATDIFINPPFNQAVPSCKISWARGKVNMAAVFMDKVIQYVNTGVRICAILPDVLRSGSRYGKWRKFVNQFCTIEKMALLGQFDSHADVDVFAIRLAKRQEPVEFKLASDHFREMATPDKKIEDLFDVCVGPVVDNRDKHEGRKRGYIISKGLEGWSMCKKPLKTRQYKGRSFNGPFVVVKRTSRMGDTHRAIATIINTPSPVYVDNHLIVLKPKSGLISDCTMLLKTLQTSRTDEWLDNAIRCRHLTVRVVAKIPIWQ
jgi:hypothetical protein